MLSDMLCFCTENQSKMSGVKASDFVALKTMKNASSALKLTLIAASIISTQLTLDSTSDISTKKIVSVNNG